jgi:hypothetical protein
MDVNYFLDGVPTNLCAGTGPARQRPLRRRRCCPRPICLASSERAAA